MGLVETISRETIRPLSPTPPENRIYNLSFLDHFNPSTYVPILYFYNTTEKSSTHNTSNLLKQSLSKALVHYYPFAGRIRDRVTIDCNDEGITFVEARVKCRLSEALENPNDEILELLFADRLQWTDCCGSFLSVQISFFDCGGLAVGVCISHKLADTATMINFINLWSSTARCCEKTECSWPSLPEFNAAYLFPRDGLPVIPEAKIEKETSSKSKRVVFEASKIDALKAIVASRGVPNPTRVEVVTAILHRSAMSASLKLNDRISTDQLSSDSGVFTALNSSVLVQSVNMRTRTCPLLPKTSVGNMSWFYAVSTSMDDDHETEVHVLVGKMKESLRSFCKRYAERMIGEEWAKVIMECMRETKEVFHRKTQKVYRYSSWCRFPIYEADFGWGKPMWVTIGGCELKNSIIMMDTRCGGGIEAVVSLEKEVMDVFDKDLELLQFASFNPSALVKTA